MNIPKRVVNVGLTELDMLTLDKLLRERIENGPMPGAVMQNCLEAIHDTLDDQCNDVLRNSELIAKLLRDAWEKHRQKLLDMVSAKKVYGFGTELVELLNAWNKNCGAEANLTTDWPAVTEALAYGRWDELVLCYGCTGYVELFLPENLGALLGWCLKMSDTPT